MSEETAEYLTDKNDTIIKDYIRLETNQDLHDDHRYNQAVKANNDGIDAANLGNFENAIYGFDRAIDFFNERKEYTLELSDAYYNRFKVKLDSLFFDFIASLGVHENFMGNPDKFRKRLLILKKMFNLIDWYGEKI